MRNLVFVQNTKDRFEYFSHSLTYSTTLNRFEDIHKHTTHSSVSLPARRSTGISNPLLSTTKPSIVQLQNEQIFTNIFPSLLKVTPSSKFNYNWEYSHYRLLPVIREKQLTHFQELFLFILKDVWICYNITSFFRNFNFMF